MKVLYRVLTIKEILKKLVPFYIKVNLNLVKRFVLDIAKGYYFNYAKRRYTTNDFSNSLELKQELKPNEAKNKNLLRAIRSIEQIQINPKKRVSHWDLSESARYFLSPLGDFCFSPH